jgi:hypothetical protein
MSFSVDATGATIQAALPLNEGGRFGVLPLQTTGMGAGPQARDVGKRVRHLHGHFDRALLAWPVCPSCDPAALKPWPMG